jgi:Ribbon-helix-helix protein, copG family
MTEREPPPTGPHGGKTTVAPSGWQRTSVYLRPDQIRALKLVALERKMNVSEVLRQAIDHELGLTGDGAAFTEEDYRARLDELWRRVQDEDGED